MLPRQGPAPANTTTLHRQKSVTTRQHTTGPKIFEPREGYIFEYFLVVKYLFLIVCRGDQKSACQVGGIKRRGNANQEHHCPYATVIPSIS